MPGCSVPCCLGNLIEPVGKASLIAISRLDRPSEKPFSSFPTRLPRRAAVP